MVRLLADCIARPSEGPGGLVAHLEAVAVGSGAADGPPEEKLAFLAGLAHDAAKATDGWQQYIRSAGAIRRGPPHAPLGAALFAFWAEDLIPRWQPDRRDPERERLFDLALDWVRMIYRHHGALDDLDMRPPWVDAGMAEEHDLRTLLDDCKRDDLDALVRKHFPEYGGRLTDFNRWYREFDRTWDRRQRVIRPDLMSKVTEEERNQLGMRLAVLGARLIYADRRHAAEWEPEAFADEQAEAAIPRHADECRKAAAKAREDGACEALLRAREKHQAEAVRSYVANADSSAFTLELPTGYGKTLTGLRVALEAVRRGRCRRLLYVAPYISILSQAAKVIQEATGLPVFLHHHLSILGAVDNTKKADREKEDRAREDHQAYDLLDTWQAPLVATTFNQLFRALFPSRAQECLRIPALDGAFVFIDEPQIVDTKEWCAFLRALAVLTRQRRCQVLFTTATLPPLADGLGQSTTVVPLVEPVKPSVSRYVIRTEATPWDAAKLAKEARTRLKQCASVAVILNTVRDAVVTYQRLREKDKDDWLFLAAMMLPGHKAAIIARVRDRLDKQKGSQKTGVVCTQVLEAGVDLSFRCLLRALPIFSSVAQAAGRANRHGEGDPAEVVVFPFVREEGRESRSFVYRDGGMRSHTDALLAENPILPEERLPEVMVEYYRRCWQQNPHLASLGFFQEAASGKWSVLGGREPFGGSYPQVEVFVPGSERDLRENYRAKLTAFRAKTAAELLERSRDSTFRRGLSFVERKQLAALLRQFVVSVPKRLAERVADAPTTEQEWLWVLKDSDLYSDQTGLAHHLTEEEAADPACLMI
jgi:CRISPR-associated endonuclease/helicase Cas3